MPPIYPSWWWNWTNKLHLNLRREPKKIMGSGRLFLLGYGVYGMICSCLYSILNLVLWFLACAIARSSSRHSLPLCVDCMVSVVFFNGFIPTKISSQESDGTKFHQSPLPAVRKCCAVLSDTFAGCAGYPEWQMFSCIVKQKIRSTFSGSLRHHGEATLEKPHPCIPGLINLHPHLASTCFCLRTESRARKINVFGVGVGQLWAINVPDCDTTL